MHGESVVEDRNYACLFRFQEDKIRCLELVVGRKFDQKCIFAICSLSQAKLKAVNVCVCGGMGWERVQEN